MIATFLALCNVKRRQHRALRGSGATEAVDQWSYYIQEHQAQLGADVDRAHDVDARYGAERHPEIRKQFDERIAGHAAEAKRYENRQERDQSQSRVSASVR